MRERRTNVDGEIEATGILNAAQVQHLGADCRELEHFLVGNEWNLASRGNHARISAEDTVDIGEDLADRGLERRGEGYGGGVGTSAAEGGDVLGVLGDALEAGDNRDRSLRKCLLNTARGDIDDAGGAVGGVSDEARLRARVRAAVFAEVGDCHGQHGH